MSEELNKPTELDLTTESLVRMQEFDVKKLPRIDELGSSLNFEKSVSPARRLISLYRRLSTTALEDFPVAILNQIKTQCDADFQKFNQILEFDTSSQQTPSTVRDAYINQLEAAYDPAFIN